MEPVKRLSTMTDLQGELLKNKELGRNIFANLMNDSGYIPIELPVVENTELFLRKSGGSLAPQMYSFRDPIGTQVSLRPEITTQIVNYYLENYDIGDSVKIQYDGPVFRYDHNLNKGMQFSQIGGEYIGVCDFVSDLEVISLASKIPYSLGVSEYSLRIADLGIVNSIVGNFDISSKNRNLIIENIHLLKENDDVIKQFAQRLASPNITGDGNRDAYLSDAIHDLNDTQARQVISGFLGWVNSGHDNNSLGRRSNDDIIDRLFDKLKNNDSLEVIQQALSVVSKLIQIQGEFEDCLNRAKSIFESLEVELVAIHKFENLLKNLNEVMPADCKILVDFGLVREFNYYTGIIFEIEELSEGALLGGGGRYDGMGSSTVSGKTLDALGFAFDLDKMLFYGDASSMEKTCE